MMTQIHMWQLFIDIGLISSVMAVTIKAVKASRIPGMLPKTRELEGSLRSLIAEAERAGLQLNDQLLRREQNIQKSLSEIQEHQAQMTTMLAEAELLHSKLQSTRTETVRIVQDLRAGFERGMQSETGRLAEQLVSERAAVSPSRTKMSADNSSALTRQIEIERASVLPDQQEHGGFVQHVYAGTLANHPSAPSASPTALQQQRGSGASASELQRTYESAEAMIREGKAVESIASQVKLPVEGVKLLAQMIEVEREEDSRRQDPSAKFATFDSRLGALGSARRQTSLR